MTGASAPIMLRIHESPSKGAQAESGESGEIDADALVDVLERIAEREAPFTERVYEIFFDRRPDARELFGPHAIAEQEEMMRETLRSIHALCEDQAWLADNLAALGRSHHEYGVTSDMYRSFAEVFLDCGREVLDDGVGDGGFDSLRLALLEITRQMSEAGELESLKRSG